jgi:hypothetical protein
MRLFNRKSQLQRLLETVNDSLDASTSGIKSRLPSGDSAKTLTAGLIAAGSLGGLTAASAGISSLRRRSEGARDEGAR